MDADSKIPLIINFKDQVLFEEREEFYFLNKILILLNILGT